MTATPSADIEYRHIQVTPIAGALGADVAGVDLAGPLHDAAIAEINRALLAHLVIFFHDQVLDPGALVRFGRRVMHRITIRGDRPR